MLRASLPHPNSLPYPKFSPWITLFICFLLAKAEVYNTEGNERYRQEDLTNAIHFFTEGINVNCKDEELKAVLYNNRAEAYFCLG